MSAGKRYKFTGSTFQVQTGFVAHSPAQAITAITKADPGAVTATGSNYTDGTVVKITDVVGMTEVNDKLFVVDDGAANTFELANTDTSGYGTYVSGGHVAVAALSAFCELTGVNQQDGAADQIEVTTICSTAKEFEQGLSDSGTIQLDYNFAPNETVQTAIRAAKISGDKIAFKVTLPGTGGSVIMIGTVQQSSFTGSVSDAVWKGSTTVRLSGDIFVLPGV